MHTRLYHLLFVSTSDYVFFVSLTVRTCLGGTLAFGAFSLRRRSRKGGGKPPGFGSINLGCLGVSKQVLCIVFRQSAARVKLKGCGSVLRILQTSKCQQVIAKGQIMTYLICQGFLASRWLCALRKSFTVPPTIMVSLWIFQAPNPFASPFFRFSIPIPMQSYRDFPTLKASWIPLGQSKRAQLFHQEARPHTERGRVLRPLELQIGPVRSCDGLDVGGPGAQKGARAKVADANPMETLRS